MPAEMIPVALAGPASEWIAAERRTKRYPSQAVLVAGGQVTAAYGDGTLHLRLPAPVAPGTLVTFQRDPAPGDVFEVLGEERDHVVT